MRVSMCRGLVVAVAALVVGAWACGSDVTEGSGGSGSGAASSSSSASGGSSSSSSASGGSASGGSAAGGSATGGSASGGMAGAGGAAGGSGGQGGAAAVMPECTSAGVCTIHNDCCNCIALAPGETPPTCNIVNCLIPKCTELGVPTPQPQCRVGRCVAAFDCDHSKVTCLQPTPACPAGQTPSVMGQCWGGCVPANECAEVDSCAQCDAGKHVCVNEVAQLGPVHHCVDVPSACQNMTDCACMGASVCVNAFNQCVDGPGQEISCQCPTC